MANNSLQSVNARSVKSFGNDIDHPSISANRLSDGPRSNPLRFFSSVCPSQLIVGSLDPPLAPFSNFVESADNTAAGMRFPTLTSAGQVPCRGFSAGAFSRSDLDKLLHFSLFEVAGNQPSDRAVGGHNIWPSIPLEDGRVSERSPIWSPPLQVGQPQTCRYQILPFFYNHRWQLAIFDTSECTLCCCDTMGNGGKSMSTFIVSIALWYCIR